MGYESPDLPSMAYLACKGHVVRPTVRKGKFLFFEASCDEPTAEALLASPEAALVSRAFDELRKLRRVCHQTEGMGGDRR